MAPKKGVVPPQFRKGAKKSAKSATPMPAALAKKLGKY